ncbi:MAG: hypothetical protein COZ05_02850 [Armatimonadetes bacterium CG_4_10_14_3_um_filter_59_10]|nr:MAG: hypothetical protein COZ05_02850 [Armatimonadetes bacterium CG_4_10_14_3_um_filter_59_10]
MPDLVHFYNWTYSDQHDRDTYGVFGTPLAYEQVGGLDVFRRGIAEMQTKWQRPVSLYTLIDRFRMSALPDQALAQELAATAHQYKALENDDSAALRGAKQVDGIIFPWFGNERWTDFFINDIARMQRDTGCQIVYVDVFRRFSHLRGRSGLSPRDDDLNVVKRMRGALPDNVALWTEYPFTDVASQYADGCLQYYFLELNQTFARRYNISDRADNLFAEMPLSIGRYALPRYRIFCLAGYAEMSNTPCQVDAVFVKGEAYFEDTYRLEFSRLRVNINADSQSPTRLCGQAPVRRLFQQRQPDPVGAAGRRRPHRQPLHRQEPEAVDALQWPTQDLLRGGADSAAPQGCEVSRRVERIGSHTGNRERSSEDRHRYKPAATRLRCAGLGTVTLREKRRPRF